MKKLLLFLLALNSFNSFCQDDVFGNTPVQGIKTITRGISNDINDTKNNVSAKTSIITPSTPTGSSAEVGVTAGQLSVSLTGSANYSIPIAMPPGVNGIAPQISLSYNSQGGNDLAGYGWNISGISVISRIPTTKFHENLIDGVDFNKFDRFAFDGQRLMVKNGTSGVYGASETVYETENFSNVKITSYGAHPSGANYGPAYFIVQYSDGSKAYYGNSTDSKSITDWAITYWENPQGLRISYNYILSNNILSINTIKYGSLLASLPINEVTFIYKSRQRPEEAFIGGQSFIRNTILSEIKVKGNNVGFRNYLLYHEITSLGYERLKSITEKSGDNTKSLNPTVFNYDSTSENVTFNTNVANITLDNVRSDNATTVQGDFDGDGSMDIILYPTIGPDTKRKYYLFTKIQGTGTNIGTEHEIGLFSDIFPISWLSWNNKLMPSQGWCAVQGDDTTTTFKTYSTGIVSPIYFQYERTYQFPKINFGYYTYPCNNENPLTYNDSIGVIGAKLPPNDNLPVYNVVERIIPKEYVSGDFNGDGLSDVLVVERPVTFNYYTGGCSGTNNTFNYTGGRTYFLNLDRRITTDYINFAGFLQVSSSSKFVTADFNGDGKSDIFVFDNNVCNIYTLNESNNTVLLTTINSGNINVSKPVLMGDYNGDGKADFIIPKQNQSPLFTKYISTGVNVNASEVNLGIGNYFTGFYNGNESNIQHLIPNDFNNDGKTDIIVTECKYRKTGLPSILLLNRYIKVNYFGNKGNTFQSSLSATKVDIGGLNHFPIPVSLSFDKTNSNRQISFISNKNIYSAISPKDNIIDTSLKEVILGNGVKEVISYQPLIGDDSSYYDNIFEPSTYTENYPNTDIKVANSFRVVTKLEQITAAQYKKQMFKYYGAVSNVEGLGFLGFRATARTNWHNDDNPIISSISKQDINKRGAVTETYSVLGEIYGNFGNYSPTNFINKSNMTYADELFTNKVFKINNPTTVSANGLENTSQEVQITFDTNNFPLSTTTISKNGATIEKTEVINLDYFPASTGDVYFMGRLRRKSSSMTHNGDTMTSDEKYVYNPAHLVSQIEKKGHLTNYLKENNTYDTYGNLYQKKVTAVGLPPRISTFNYDSLGRFLLSSIDTEGLITSFTYNQSTGLTMTQTLPSNPGFPLISTNFFDVWGKKIKETDYLGKNINFSNTWISPGTSGKYTLSTLGDDNSATYVQFDEFGRKIAEGFRTINLDYFGSSNISWKRFEYDIYDRVIKSYEPALSRNPVWTGLFNSTTFDVYGRIIQIALNNGKISNIEHIGLTSKASDGVSNTTTVKNSLGKVTSMNDNGGTINYQYYANGNVKQSNFGGVIVAIEQDGWGRKTKLTDPSAGPYRYEYNEFGEMKKEISLKGETTYTYDNYGKVIEKTIIGIGGDPTNTKTTNTYNSATKLLTNVRYDDFTGGFFTTYSYAYDDYKRMNFNDESGFNAYYQNAIQFDAFGRAEKELYTAINTSNGKRSDKWVRNTYKNGHHWQILDDATNLLLWETSSVNAKGQITNGTFGNGIEAGNIYDQYGFPNQINYNKTSYPAVNLISLNSTFNTVRGNLISRNTSLFNYFENFEYDNLDRLKKFENSSLLVENNFNTEIGTFDNTGCNLFLENNKLKIQIPNSSSKVRKLLTSTAIIGKKYIITAEINSSLDHGGYTLYEAANNSESSPRVILPVDINNNFVVTTYPNLYIEFNVSDYENCTETQDCYTNYDEYGLPYETCTTQTTCETVSGGGEVTIDNLNLNEFLIAEQTYDNLGRIEENNIGSYNYTNTPKPFQNTSVELNSGLINYFQNDRSNLDITYNAIKSPIDIIEEGKDKLSFIYNMNNSRSTMYYGGLQTDKYSRQYRKHYATNGRMEVKQDIINGTVEFITYIGGDAYTAPVILKSDGTTQDYMYLHRDYLGSIVAVTNQTGSIVEKRLFDAWGNIKAIQDGNGNVLTKMIIIERGYTSHEHLQGVNLIHMNGRLFDSVVHRFLQPDNFVQDPTNTQNYNRYSYCLNNPLKYTDKNGEWFWIAVGIVALLTTDVGYEIQKFISPVAIKIDIKLGSHQLGLGIDVSIGIPTSFPFSYRENWGATYFWKNYGDYKGWETRHGVERSFLSIYHTGYTDFKAGEFSQRVGYHKLGMIPSFAGIEVSNDLYGDGGDRFRTAHQKINIFGLTIGNIIFTGDPAYYNNDTFPVNGRDTYYNGPYGANKYSAGIFYLGIGGFRLGWDSEGIRHVFQNTIGHDWISPSSPHIYRTNRGSRLYFFFGNGLW